MNTLSSKSFLSKLILPFAWTIITIVLLCIPGSALPGTGKFIFGGFDKLVHFVLFGGIVILWGIYLSKASATGLRLPKLIRLAIFSISLGICLEFVQLYFIPGRSFDINDIFADSIGAIIAFLVLLPRAIHKR